jgi:hypothetical protein
MFKERPHGDVGGARRVDAVAGTVGHHHGAGLHGLAECPLIAADLLPRIRCDHGAKLGAVPVRTAQRKEPDHDRGAKTGTGIDPQIVGQTRDRTKAGARAAGRGVAVIHAARDVGHAAAAIQRQHFQSRAVCVLAVRCEDVPAARMFQQVGREFGGNDRHVIETRLGHAGAPRASAHQPAGFGNLARIGNGGDHVTSSARASPWCPDPAKI